MINLKKRKRITNLSIKTRIYQNHKTQIKEKGNILHTRMLFLLFFSLFFIPSIVFQHNFVALAEETWYDVTIITGSGPKTSQAFRITEPQFRIEYSYIASIPSIADFRIYVYQLSEPFDNIDYIHEYGESKDGLKDVYSGNDMFFIFVDTYKVEFWQISIKQQGIVEQIPSGQYTTVVTFSGTEDMTTPSFNILGDHFIVNWQYTAIEPHDAEFWVLTFPSGSTEFINILGNSGPSKYEKEYIYNGQFSDFYFIVTTDEYVSDWELNVKKMQLTPSSISCSATPFTALKGSMVSINGSISPAYSGRTVTLEFTDPYTNTFTQTTVSNPDGTYNFHYYPTILGSYNVEASIDSDIYSEGAKSNPVIFNVIQKTLSTITCNVSKPEYQIDEQIVVTGFLDPQLSGVSVTVTFVDPNEELSQMIVETGDGGSFELYYTPLSEGTHTVYTSWPGDEVYTEAESYVTNFSVNKKTTSISCNVIPTQVAIMNPIDIYGLMDPELSGVNITLTLTITSLSILLM